MSNSLFCVHDGINVGIKVESITVFLAELSQKWTLWRVWFYDCHSVFQNNVFSNNVFVANNVVVSYLGCLITKKND